MMRVLVCFGSKRGGTAGLAAMIGDALIVRGRQS
jgi:menaquinone-dependent protoporphyrinogen oxidase